LNPVQIERDQCRFRRQSRNSEIAGVRQTHSILAENHDGIRKLLQCCLKAIAQTAHARDLAGGRHYLIRRSAETRDGGDVLRSRAAAHFLAAA